MAEKEVVETSEAQIAVHWPEEELYYPSTKFIAQANKMVLGAEALPRRTPAKGPLARILPVEHRHHRR